MSRFTYLSLFLVYFTYLSCDKSDSVKRGELERMGLIRCEKLYAIPNTDETSFTCTEYQNLEKKLYELEKAACKESDGTFYEGGKCPTDRNDYMGYCEGKKGGWTGRSYYYNYDYGNPKNKDRLDMNIDLCTKTSGTWHNNPSFYTEEEFEMNNNNITDRDKISPTTTITTNETSLTAASPFTITITFSEEVSGFELDDISVTNGIASNLQTSDNTTYTSFITPSSDPASITIDIADTIASDSAGNPNLAANQFSINYDTSILTEALSTSESSPTNKTSFSVTITFSEAVSGFELTDLTVVNGTASNLQTSDNTVFTVDIAPTPNEEVSINIETNVAKDSSTGQKNNRASAQLSIISDQIPPSAPTVTTSLTPTKDHTPTWIWNAGGGGNGTFRFKINDTDLTSGTTETTNLSYTPASDLSSGTHTLYVQEKDSAGNWSDSGSLDIVVVQISYFIKTIDGANSEILFSVNETSSGDIIAAGYTGSPVEGFIMKLDSSGTILWNKTIGGTGNDSFRSVTETSSGDIIIAGYTTSDGAGEFDGFIVRLDSSGSIIWAKTIGGTNIDSFHSAIETSSREIIAAGYTKSDGAGEEDGFIVKLDSSGTILWNKTIGGTGSDRFQSATMTSTGEIIAVGYTNSDGEGLNEGFMVKLTSDGEVIWNKTIGGGGTDYFYSVTESSSGDIIVAGDTASDGGGTSDGFIVKITSDGEIIWDKTIGGTNIDKFYSVIEISSGAIIATGYTSSTESEFMDKFIVKLDSNGDIGTGTSTWLANANNADTVSNANNANTAADADEADNGANANNANTVTNANNANTEADANDTENIIDLANGP